MKKTGNNKLKQITALAISLMLLSSCGQTGESVSGNADASEQGAVQETSETGSEAAQTDAGSLSAEAKELVDQGEYEKALPLIQEALAMDDASAQNMMGN